MTIHVCRKEHFCAAHKLYNPHWSKERNKEVFGPCANENWHGHNFEMTIDVKGTPDPETGFLMDMKLLGKLIREHLLMQVDHKNLNLDVPFMQGKMSSCENLAMEFWKILSPLIEQHTGHRAHLYCIELYETPKNFVRYYGEE